MSSDASLSRLLMWGAFRLLPTRSKEAQMPILKRSKETDELLKGWFIYSPNASFRSTGNTPPNSDKKLDERSTPIPEEENPESAATGETP